MNRMEPSSWKIRHSGVCARNPTIFSESEASYRKSAKNIISFFARQSLLSSDAELSDGGRKSDEEPEHEYFPGRRDAEDKTEIVGESE